MAVFTMFLNLEGKEKVEIGNVVFDNPDLNVFKSVEMVQQDAESVEDAISVTFVPA